MTTDTICDTIRQAIAAEAAKDGGPDVDNNTMTLQGCVEEDPALKAVLRAKGELVIRIKPLWPVEVDLDHQQAVRDLAARAGVDQSLAGAMTR